LSEHDAPLTHFNYERTRERLLCMFGFGTLKFRNSTTKKRHSNS
jgi:hypothetical protein